MQNESAKPTSPTGNGNDVAHSKRCTANNHKQFVSIAREQVEPPSEREGDRVSGGRSQRAFVVARSPSVGYAASSLPEGALKNIRKHCNAY